MAVIGVGIVGCGGNAPNHAEVWSSMDEANIVGVCDIDEPALLAGAKTVTHRAMATRCREVNTRR